MDNTFGSHYDKDRDEPRLTNQRELILAYLKLMEKQLKVTLNELSITDERGE